MGNCYMINLKPESIRWAIKSVRRDSDTYLFPMPFEYDAIEDQEDQVVDHIAAMNVCECGIRDYRTALTPKGTKGFRVATQLDPIDTLISLAIIYEVADDLERARMPKSTEQVFSFRLKPERDGSLYDPAYDWTRYKKRTREIADSGTYSYVVATDISDFYPSIYLHDIETVLGEALKDSGRKGYGKVLIDYVRAMHLSQTHKGLPVGPQFSRPIAELILDKIDRQLQDGDAQFVRYVDDIVIFTDSRGSAYEALSRLAQVLYDRRGLKLNEKKTEILEVSSFRERFIKDPNEFEHNSIMESFTELLDELDIDENPYEDIEPEDLSVEQWEQLRSINLQSLVEQELAKAEPDGFVVSFVLANLARLDDTGIAEKVLSAENIIKLFPRLRTIINYLDRVRNFSPEQKDSIGKKILGYVDDSYVSVLNFNRMWFMHLFTKTTEWDNADTFAHIYDKYSDNETRRETLLSRGRARDIEFFRQKKYESLDVNSWLRRSFLAAMSCLPEDERKPWYRSRALHDRDFLDKVVERWAQRNHF